MLCKDIMTSQLLLFGVHDWNSESHWVNGDMAGPFFELLASFREEVIFLMGCRMGQC